MAPLPATGRHRAPVIDAVIAARDEAPTVAANVGAALGCGYVREVLVADDGSTDTTAEIAADAGAKVVTVPEPTGAKGRALAAAVARSDADAFLFVDADPIGLVPDHLDAVCRPWLEGRAALSVGVFDYGPRVNPLVLRMPPLSGQRLVPRWVWEAIPATKVGGYTIEVRINEVVAEARLPTVVRTMKGVRQRTKRDKLGRPAGLAASVGMWADLARLLAPGGVRWRTYAHYLRGLTVDP